MSLQNFTKGYASRVIEELASPRYGVVTSYDPDTHTAKVTMEPWAEPTDWLPISNLLSTANFTIRVGLPVGSTVLLVPAQFDSGSYVIIGAIPTDLTPPPKTPKTIGGAPQKVTEAEFTVLAKGGSVLRFNDDGSIYAKSPTKIEFEAPTINTKATWNHDGQMNVSNGSVAVSGGDVTADSISLKNHKHTGVQTGSGQTGGPV